MGLDWSEVDAEAEALEHAISARLEQAIADYLGEPLEDPHGHLIPTREGKLARRELRPLHICQPGERVVIREVQDDRPERLRRWSDLGLRPGALVTMVSRQPLDGTFHVQVGDQVAVLGTEGLAGLLVEPAASARRPAPPAKSRGENAKLTKTGRIASLSQPASQLRFLASSHPAIWKCGGPTEKLPFAP